MARKYQFRFVITDSVEVCIISTTKQNAIRDFIEVFGEYFYDKHVIEII